MTVKELKEILDACNEDAVIVIATTAGNYLLNESQVFHVPEYSEVVIDPTYSNDVEN